MPRSRPGRQYEGLINENNSMQQEGLTKEEENEGQSKQTERQKILEEMKKKSSIQSKVLIFDTKKVVNSCYFMI